jgi:transcriptional regulator with XRE-family HTH domain
MTLKYTFDEEYGLHGAKIVGPDTYPELSKDTRTLPQKITGYLLGEVGQATATEIAEAMGVDRSAVSRILNSDDRYSKMPNTGGGRAQLYAVRPSDDVMRFE